MQISPSVTGLAPPVMKFGLAFRFGQTCRISSAQKRSSGPKGDKGDSSSWRNGVITYTPLAEVVIAIEQLQFATSPFESLDVEGGVAWQSFRAIATGTMTRLDIAISAFKGTSNEDQFCGIVAIRQGEEPSGTEIGRLAISMDANDVPNPQFIGFPIAGITLTSGETYT